MAKTQNPEKYLPSKTDIEQFNMLYPMVLADLEEIKELSKKKQDGVLNQGKVKILNKKLAKIKAILSNEPTNEFIELLDEEALPTNSDAVLMIVQFKSGLEQFHEKYFTKDKSLGESYKTWKTRD
jgi:hypothetical protein